MKILLLGDINYDPQPGDDIIRRGTDIHDIDDNSINMAICTNLPEVNRSEIMSFLAKLYNTLVHGGQVAFQVPSAEFATKLVFTNQFNSPAMFMLYGSSKRPFRACYTMAALRAIVESAKFQTIEAQDDLVTLSSGNEKIEMPVHTLVARKA